MKFLTVVAALLLFTNLAAADEKLPPRVVRVVGTAEVKVDPDRAVIEVGVEKQNGSARVAKQLADDTARGILATLHSNGIDEKDVQTTYISLQPESYTRKDGVWVSNFVAGQTLTITVRDLPKLDSLLESLIKAGGNRINSVWYETSDLRKYRDQARDLAVKAAREKADALAKALGESVGKAYSIDEVPELAYQYSGMLSNASYQPSRVPAQTGPATAAGQKTITASIVVTFDLN